MNAPATTAPLATKAASRRAGQLGVELGDMQSAGRAPSGSNDKYTVEDVESYAEAVGKLRRDDPPDPPADPTPADERGIDAVPEPDPETGKIAEAPPDPEAEAADEEARQRVAELEAKVEALSRQVADRGVAPADVVKAGPKALGDATPAELMPERSHRQGCPAPPERVEAYTATRPARVDNGIVVEAAHDVTMLHCIECGETVQLV